MRGSVWVREDEGGVMTCGEAVELLYGLTRQCRMTADDHEACRAARDLLLLREEAGSEKDPPPVVAPPPPPRRRGRAK